MKNFITRILAEVTGGKPSRLRSPAFILRLSGAFFVFLNQLLLARFIGAKGFGDYTVIFTWINLLIVYCLFGFDSSALSFFPVSTDQNQLKRVKGFLRFSKRTIILLSVMSSLLLLLLLLKNSGKYGVTFSEALFWALLLLPFLSLTYYYSAVLLALRRVKTSLLPVNIILPVSVSIACFIYYQMNKGIMKVDAALFIYLCCVFFVFFIARGRLKKHLRPELHTMPEEYNRKEWVAKSAAHFAVTACNLILKSAGILFISYYFGNTRAGIYGVAVLISSAIPFLISWLETRYIQQFHELFESRQQEKLSQVIFKSNKLIFSVTLPVAFVIIVFGKFILELFGTAFIAAYLPLIILTIGQMINMRTGFFSSVLKSTSNQQTLIITCFVATALNLVLNFIFVPALGIHGAAVASIFSSGALNLMVYLMTKKKFSFLKPSLIF